MELRKIQITGGSTCVVSLPKKWVDRAGLGRSDTVAIHEEPDGSLLLVPHSEGRPRSRTIAVDLPPDPSADAIVRRLVGAYLAGADEIIVRSRGRLDPRARQTVRDIARDLVGVEIVDESADSLTLHDLVGAAEMDLGKTVTRMHRLARIMHDDALTAFDERNLLLAADVSARDDEVDRLEWMVSKQMHALLEQPRLAARLDIRPAEALNLTLVARALERMADHASKICKNVRALDGLAVPPAVRSDFLAHGRKVQALWDHAFTALKKDDFDAGSSAVDEGKALAPWRATLAERLTTAGTVAGAVPSLTLIADSIDRTRSYAIDIAETAMNQSFQTKN